MHWLFVLCVFYIGTRMHTADGKAALLIVDIQDCFLPEGSLAVNDAQEVLPVINKMRTDYEHAFSLVVVSQDWHCSDHVSFASQHPGYSVFDQVTLQYNKYGKLCYSYSVPNTYRHARACETVSHNVTQILWPDHCIADVTSGAASSSIDPKLIRKSSDVIVRKGVNCEVDSYSLFYDNGRFQQTSFHRILQDVGIDTVYVTGLALDYCVYFTSVDARRLGYTTYVVEDACRGVSTATTDAALKDMKLKGIHVINSALLEGYLTSGATRGHIGNCYVLALVATFCFLFTSSSFLLRCL